MPRFIGKNTNNNSSSFIDSTLASQVSATARAGWYTSDWYSRTFNPAAGTSLNNSIKNLNAYKIGSSGRKVRCLDLTDQDMSNSPLKRFHQVIICGNAVEPIDGSQDPLIGGYKNTEEYVITAQLPNSFSYSIGSSYSTPFKSVLDFSSSNGLTNAATSGQNSALFGLATMSVWESPNPLNIRLTLSCIDDIGSGTNQNTLEAIDLLSRWSLPYSINKWGMYAGLPGPSVPPITINYNKYENGVLAQKNGESMKLTVGNDKDSTRLSVLIGGMLFIDYCILETVEVSYPNTKAQYLHDYHVATFTDNSSTADAGIRLLPIRCDITLTFKTIMGLTQTNFRNMLALRNNCDPSNMNEINIGGIQSMLGDRIGGNVSEMLNDTKTAMSKVQNAISSL